MRRVGPKKKDNLPQEVVLDILSRLPASSLYRFRCLSKTWCGLTCDPEFLKLHRDRSQNKKPFPLLMFCERNPILDVRYPLPGCAFYSPYCIGMYGFLTVMESDTQRLVVEDRNGQVRDHIPIPFEGEICSVVTVIPSGYGLFCLRRPNGKIFACNTYTREFLQLPEPQPSTWTEGLMALIYIPSANMYKLFHLRYICHEDYENDVTVSNILDIRSDGTQGELGNHNPWRVLDDSFPYPKPLLLHMVANVNGVIHWWKPVASDIIPSLDKPEMKLDDILSLDMEKEEFLRIAKPQGCSKFDSSTTSVGFKGQLSLTKFMRDGGDLTVDIWVLKDPRNSTTWVKDYNIRLPSSLGIWSIHPLCVGEGEILLRTYFGDFNGDTFVATWRQIHFRFVEMWLEPMYKAPAFSLITYFHLNVRFCDCHGQSPIALVNFWQRIGTFDGHVL